MRLLELFSGTNPYEAVSSANAYLENISNNPNVKFMLTTHFIDLCKKINTKTIENINMKTNISNNQPKYFYKIPKGISEIKGGITVLRDVGYPDELINKTENILEKM